MYTDQDSLADVQIIVENIRKLRQKDVNAILVVDAKNEESERIRAHLLNMRVISYPYVQLFNRDSIVAFGGLFDQDTLDAISRELKK